jgi:nicotinamidase/pyrazinamidase
MTKTCLFVIDPQKDFMPERIKVVDDKEVTIPAGALGVTGADEDMKRLAGFIASNKKTIDTIIITLDSHHTVHVAHPIWWVDENGNAPDPFTPITKEDVLSDNPVWKCREPEFQNITEYYISQLAEKGITHMVWPPHCIIGSDGHAVEDTLFEAILDWEKDFKVAEYVNKGTSLFTEHFGAFEAVVPIAGYDETTFNDELLDILGRHDRVVVAGEASSHCVAQTLIQMLEKMDEENIRKIIYLEDACSPVTGCEGMEQDFLGKLKEAGVTVATTTEDLAL